MVRIDQGVSTALVNAIYERERGQSKPRFLERKI